MQIPSTEVIRQDMLIFPGNCKQTMIEKFRGKSSIDVSIGEIIYHTDDSDKKKVVVTDKTYELESQETVYLVSKEELNVPKGYVAYVFLKNRFSQKGFMAFNTGIIDGGFKGPISTLATNLSSKTIELGVEKLNTDKFFRVVFHKIDFPKDELEDVETSPNNRDDYMAYLKADLRSLPKYFLDRDKLKKQIDESLNSKTLNISMKNFAIIFGLLSLIVTLGPSIAESLHQKILQNQKIEILEKRVRDLEKKVLNVTDETKAPKSDGKQVS
ncbi:hypothetical protein [Idiomarina baltica]|uniref:dUTPase-like domain-containing protein n=1 Tax=Idiomarina baltica OS145 TaxID=314276 RepID=A0ABM9WQ98_9GAMM|nr:hypothetical protein [Idiomarina baltica]EAQ33199.1 hypothetical protein OS145_02485 [Idiomarina baltica OS145]